MAKSYFSGVFFVLICFSCQKSKELRFALDYAKDNKSELNDVLNYYRVLKKDSLKLKAAEFLIMNMSGHSFASGTQLDKYRQQIWSIDKPVSIGKIEEIWRNILNDQPTKTDTLYDAHLMKSSYLINNIESAFHAWSSSPWHKEVNFNAFCKYILPYRFSDEQLCEHWRDSLRNEYLPLIEGVTDMKIAFYILQTAVHDKMRSTRLSCPYNLDVLTLNELRLGTCAQRCIVLGNVLRSVGIPASYEYVNSWANYSMLGHTWVALIGKGGEAYTLFEKDTIPTKYNRIDASMFIPTYFPEKDYPFRVDSVKRVAKIYRMNYYFKKERDYPEGLPLKFRNVFSEDVSSFYNLKDSVKLKVSEKYKLAYLCTFHSEDDWKPATWGKVIRGECMFDNLGSSIVYLPIVMEGRIQMPIGYPFILHDDGSIRRLWPNTSKLQKITLYRKYPLFTHWTNQWGKMIGGRFEGSNTSDFKRTKLLYEIKSTPVYRNEMNINGNVHFRYVRYVCPEKCRTPLAELEFYSASVLLNGLAMGEGLSEESITNAFDHNRETLSNTKEENYWIGLDLGASKLINRIVYYPKHDSNFIEEGHVYELFYYSNQWISLGEKTAKSNFLTYSNVPSGSLLLLKDYTEGKEERIFTFVNGKQIWW